MSHASDRFYFGRASFRVTAEAIAFFGPAVTERIASYQVKKLAFRASPKNAGQIAFWAAVLAQSRTLKLPSDEIERLRYVGEFKKDLARLELRSRPQVTP